MTVATQGKASTSATSTIQGVFFLALAQMDNYHLSLSLFNYVKTPAMKETNTAVILQNVRSTATEEHLHPVRRLNTLRTGDADLRF